MGCSWLKAKSEATESLGNAAVFDFSELLPYLIVFGTNVASGFMLPFPEEVTVVWAGVWTASAAASHGPYRWLMLPVALVSVVIGDMVLYAIGRRYGTRLLRYRWLARFFPEAKRQRIERNFHRYGINILLFGRLLPTIRGPLFLTAGMMRLPLVRFLIADGIGAIIGNTLLFFLGFWFGDAFMDLIANVEKEAEMYRPILILAGLAAVSAYMLYHFLRSPVTTGDPAEIPLIGNQVAARIDSESKKVPIKDYGAGAANPPRTIKATSHGEGDGGG
jgi:membrane protein DedA with SNARE-associated domain